MEKGAKKDKQNLEGHSALHKAAEKGFTKAVEKLIQNKAKIDIKDNTKFLGVIIDKFLSFQQHIQYVKGKIARGIGILYKCKCFFGQKIGII